mmetsp:Transcript_15678/g.26009  ORF Transcript_15678/g.26009 Transcript_15678/m.26009 type:complete len:296 (+) Transcript_15678:124-1011(+)|eukprot:CAMPEP_0184649230 /NCGR_PEP_ID=MMETSP0308-20130426/6539_1 /TAXON_ID=38269 /ORGANISM="Gloeochaete witrockiana, Strain SAG 46.84" /LENGTH=295 /DNA_ID=CAMNT_0027081769 /DNA_START=110 /DNA_END=997 /DNA_ORIENTATION=-
MAKLDITRESFFDRVMRTANTTRLEKIQALKSHDVRLSQKTHQRGPQLDASLDAGSGVWPSLTDTYMVSAPPQTRRAQIQVTTAPESVQYVRHSNTHESGGLPEYMDIAKVDIRKELLSQPSKPPNPPRTSMCSVVSQEAPQFFHVAAVSSAKRVDAKTSRVRSFAPAPRALVPAATTAPTDLSTEAMGQTDAMVDMCPVQWNLPKSYLVPASIIPRIEKRAIPTPSKPRSLSQYVYSKPDRAPDPARFEGYVVDSKVSGSNVMGSHVADEFRERAMLRDAYRTTFRKGEIDRLG